MKTPDEPLHQPQADKVCYCLVLLCWYVLFAGRLSAQDIPLKNPSLEGIPRVAVLPPYWLACNKSPDTHPGKMVSLPAADGKTYVGVYSNAIWREGFCQQLESSLKAGVTYTLSFDLAYPPVYHHVLCYATLAIYGGNSLTDTAVCFWKSGEFYHKDWKRYTATFTPDRDCSYISFWPYVTSPCKTSHNGTAALVDNFSPYIGVPPRISLRVQPTCSHANTGEISAKIADATGPYTYTWTPGGKDTSHITNLSAGVYEVTVTAANGLSAKAQAMVPVADVASRATVTPSKCYGDNKNKISVNTSGGISPYRYYFNNSNNSTYTPVFEQLPPGYYNILVKDERGCSDTLNNIEVTEPPPLVIQQAEVIPCSCGEAANGKIIPLVQGGMPPYEYRVNNNMWQTDNVFSRLSPGNYQYEIKDQQACSVTGAGEITSPWKNCLVVMPSAFSPNGDGNNDVFRPKVYDDIHNYQLNIYNRWGALVFRTNNPGIGWDGSHKGILQEAQGFIYICTFNDRNNIYQEMKGTVTLVH